MTTEKQRRAVKHALQLMQAGTTAQNIKTAAVLLGLASSNFATVPDDDDTDARMGVNPAARSFSE